MAIGLKRASLHIIIGVIAAVLVIAAVMAGTSYIQSTAKGSLTVQIKDKPVELDHLNMTIDSAKICDQNGTWYNLELKSSAVYFDLLSLENVTETLSETQLPAGNYSMIWMHVLTVNATFPDNSTADLTLPSDWLKIHIKPHLMIESNTQKTIVIDLQPENITNIKISHSLNICPVIIYRSDT